MTDQPDDTPSPYTHLTYRVKDNMADVHEKL